MTIPQVWDNEAGCSITLGYKSLTEGSDAAVGLFYTIPHDRMVSLRIAAELSPTGGHANWEHDISKCTCVHSRRSGEHKRTLLHLMRVLSSG